MSEEKKLGPNQLRLLSQIVVSNFNKASGGHGAWLNAIASGQIPAMARAGKQDMDNMILAMKSAPDNPYGEDDEVIAGVILKSISEVYLKDGAT